MIRKREKEALKGGRETKERDNWPSSGNNNNNKTKQNKTKTGREQNKTKQNKTKQNKTKQRRRVDLLCEVEKIRNLSKRYEGQRGSRRLITIIYTLRIGRKEKMDIRCPGHS